MSAIFRHLENKNWAQVIAVAEEESSAVDAYGMNPLHHAAGMNAPVDVVNRIISANESTVSSTDNDGRIPLHYACDYQSNFEIVGILVDKYTEGVLVKDNNGLLPLDYALDNETPKTDVVEVLQGAAASVSKPAQEGILEELAEAVGLAPHPPSRSGPPALKKGMLSKEGHLIKNWKERFFVLEAGLISYYTREQSTPPFGTDLKGTVELQTYDLVHHAEEDKVLLQENTGKIFLMKAKSVAEAFTWKASLKEHIAYIKAAKGLA